MRRRDFIGAGAGALTTGLVGCLNSNDSGAGTPTDEATDAPTVEPTEEPTDAATPESASYTVSMAPVGDVTFDAVPETWVANNGSWADMGIALGMEPPKGVWLTGRYHTQYYDGIDGVSVDKSGMVDLSQDGVSKELFYELEGDFHAIDPNFLMNRFDGWEQADIDEVEANIGPFFGNSIFSRGYTWHEDYQYYGLMEAFEKLARVFQRTDRYEAFASLHEEFQASISEIVPPEGERPAAAVLWAGGDQPEAFFPYVMSEGTSFKQWNDLRVRDALAETDVKDFHSNRGQIDYETLLEVDPEIILLRGQEAKTGEEFRNTVLSFMEDHDVASSLTAVQRDDVYRGGPLYQGPITNLVVTERAASQVYDVEDELFDRSRVADIVNGDA
ncbi:ABC transporter substrate-binding protein [Halorarum halobium]|uniref:ABC transporter substrate-binding protein n=1 Tax=Halorarum halobium TaxID=3075121 RepID=UPI0028A6D6AC|nr:ABC transporter substrate-binding protein [Halobaculum sp. XH14]